MTNQAAIITNAEADILFARIRGEFLEMPGLRLTVSQAQRLFALDDSTCSQVLGRLVQERFLCRTAHDMYQRAAQGAASFPRL